MFPEVYVRGLCTMEFCDYEPKGESRDYTPGERHPIDQVSTKPGYVLVENL